MNERAVYHVAIELLIGRFRELLGEAMATVPPSVALEFERAKLEISALRERVRAAEAEMEAMGEENSAALDLVEAAVRWRKEYFAPTLEAAVDRYQRRHVQRPR